MFVVQNGKRKAEGESWQQNVGDALMPLFNESNSQLKDSSVIFEIVSELIGENDTNIDRLKFLLSDLKMNATKSLWFRSAVELKEKFEDNEMSTDGGSSSSDE